MFVHHAQFEHYRTHMAGCCAMERRRIPELLLVMLRSGCLLFLYSNLFFLLTQLNPTINRRKKRARPPGADGFDGESVTAVRFPLVAVAKQRNGTDNVTHKTSPIHFIDTKSIPQQLCFGFRKDAVFPNERFSCSFALVPVVQRFPYSFLTVPPTERFQRRNGFAVSAVIQRF